MKTFVRNEFYKWIIHTSFWKCNPEIIKYHQFVYIFVFRTIFDPLFGQFFIHHAKMDVYLCKSM